MPHKAVGKTEGFTHARRPATPSRAPSECHPTWLSPQLL